MDYSKLSDFEINKAVAELQSLIINEQQGASLKASSSSVLVNCITESWEFNPCNNPSDAWPIVVEIWGTLMSVVSYDFGVGLGESKATLWDARARMYGDDKLRAAMIVYLMMKEEQC